MIFIGVDPSLTNTGLVVLNQKGYPIHHEVISTKEKGIKRLTVLRAMFAHTILQIIERYPMDELKIFLEGYSFNSKGSSAISIAEWGGVLRTWIYDNDLDYLEVPPRSVKKFATGRGNADKIQVATMLQKKYGVIFDTEHEFDAYGLAQFGRAYFEFEADLTAYQKESIAEVRKGA